MRNAKRITLPPMEIDPGIGASYKVEAQIGDLIRRAHQCATSIFETVMAGFEVTPVQFAILAKLHDLDVVSQNQLGRPVGVDPPTVNGVAARLAARRLVTQNPDPHVVEAIKTRGPEVTAHTHAPLNADEAAALTRLLAKIG
jgi:MarR family transcriptional regulator, lower aerobic nicotinate degradation pathway regulator